MKKQQFRVLLRQFLFRLFDMEVLSAKAEGDASRLLGQLAALLIHVSAAVGFGALLFYGPTANGLLRFVVNMIVQHFLIATTMLVVGLFAVLSWDGIFPDRRDLQVFGPLPVTPRTMFAAKVSAVAAALGLTVVLLHSLMGLILPFLFAERSEPTLFPALTLSPTPAPVAARDLQAVMDRDLKQALTTGELAPATGIGVAIGVWKQGERRVFTYGAAKPDSIFEIGSITKTFTGLMLAQMAERGMVRLDQPVRELLPRVGMPQRNASEQEITLVDLATHHSGLPGIPDNLRPADRSNPYADYGSEQLYAFFANRGFARDPDAGWAYSNLGVGLLGHALAIRAGKSFSDQLRDEITAPLGMTDTVVELSDDQKRRFLRGRDNSHRPVHSWEFDALAGAGAIRSTADDMITYLEANLHPERHPTLRQALLLTQQPRALAEGGQQTGLAWLYVGETGTFLFGGDTAGFTSQAQFSPGADCAAIVLMNSGANTLLSAELIGEHIMQRLQGEPALSLDNALVPVSTGISGVFRSFAAYWLTMLLAGAFAYGAVLTTQGLAALLLPRRLFLRFSGYLQLAAVCVILAAYFLQPGFYSITELVGSHRLIPWLPSYWFLALYQQLNGSMHLALQPLATRAWIGLAVVLCVTPVVYALSYWRMLSAIVEEPDITPTPPGWGLSGKGRRFGLGGGARNAIAQFGVRTLARSRQHRLILSFYLGTGFAFTSLILKGAGPAANAASHSGREESMLLWSASILVMALAIIGARVAFAMPFDLKANWIFQIAGVRSGPNNLAAVRRVLYVVAVVPIWLLAAGVCLMLWPSWENAGHLAVLALTGIILVDICLLRFPKIPFTCSWLPGKSRINMVLLAALGLLLIGRDAAALERQALQDTRGAVSMLALLAFVAIGARRTVLTLASREKDTIRFEEEPTPVVMGLHLDHD